MGTRGMLRAGVAIAWNGHREESGYMVDLDAMTLTVIAHRETKGVLPLGDIATWKDTWVRDLFPASEDD